jgi:hypothetical protein
MSPAIPIPGIRHCSRIQRSHTPTPTSAHASLLAGALHLPSTEVVPLVIPFSASSFRLHIKFVPKNRHNSGSHLMFLEFTQSLSLFLEHNFPLPEREGSPALAPTCSCFYHDGGECNIFRRTFFAAVLLEIVLEHVSRARLCHPGLRGTFSSCNRIRLPLSVRLSCSGYCGNTNRSPCQ